MNEPGKFDKIKKNFTPEIRWVLAGVLIILWLTGLTLSTPENPRVTASNTSISRFYPYPPATQEMATDQPQPKSEDNREQTTGVILGGVVLVLIILLGTLIGIRRKPIG